MIYPRPKWKPRAVESPADILSRATAYTDYSRALVVYRWGTIVCSDSHLQRTDADYLDALTSVVHSAPDFDTILMNDNNYAVLFRTSATGIVLRDFFTDHFQEIRTNCLEGGRIEGEVLFAASDDRDNQETLIAGLYARAKLYCDAEDRVIAGRFVPEAEKSTS